MKQQYLISAEVQVKMDPTPAYLAVSKWRFLFQTHWIFMRHWMRQYLHISAFIVAYL